ncbi:MAG: GntR family transcriptional regulator [Betaproteobacteria bacterium]|nr:GntR family transcriptional regulator [Betaproteobacteria bacterium]
MPARRKPPPDTSSLPRYAQVHQSLLADIRLGKYPVGSRLPTEDELGQIYGVSRHTVREATRKLVDSGLISRHPSIGTLVRATLPATPYVSALGSFKDLLDYNNTTRLEVLSFRRVNADATMAIELRCEPGSEWVELLAMRHPSGQVAPMSYTKVYLRPEFAGIQAHLQGEHLSIYALLGKLYGQEVASVVQRIEATLMPLDATKLLHLPAGSPALRMLRCYHDGAGRLQAASVNHYIADRFQLVTSWNKATTEPFD